MKILVAVKRVVDYTVKIRVKQDQSGVDTAHVKHSINPFDEIAIEEALKLKESGIAKSVTAVTVGPLTSQETLRHALALGADAGIHILTTTPPAPSFEASDHQKTDLEPLAIAKILKAIVLRESPQLVFLGKQAIDDDSNQVGQMLAALLGWPQATFSSQINIKEDILQAVREIDGGLETINFRLPGIVTTDLRLNTPRYATLPNIMKARQKPIETINADDLAKEAGIDIAHRLKTLSVREPDVRKAGVKVSSVDDLVSQIRKVAT